MSQKALVRLFVIETLTRIDEGFKNRVPGLVSRCGGAVDMARVLDVITHQEMTVAKGLVDAAGIVREVRGFNDVQRYQEKLNKAQMDFNKVWGF